MSDLALGYPMLKIGFIGASKTGTALAAYFQSKQLILSGFYSRNHDALQETILQLRCKKFTNINLLVRDSDIIFISAKDSQIINYWHQIDHTLLTNKSVYHCSGALSSDIFLSSNAQISKGSIHPMTSIHSKNTNIKLLDKITFAIEGDNLALNQLQYTLAQTQNEFIILNKENKTQYHIACVAMTSLYLSLYLFAKEQMKNSLVSIETAIEPLLSSFTQGIMDKIKSGLKAEDIITGPLIREDHTTLRRHIAMLTGNDKKLYQSLSHNLFNALNLDTINYKELIHALEIGE